MSKLLPSPKAKQSAIHKVLKATENKHKPFGASYKTKRKASKKTGLVK